MAATTKTHRLDGKSVSLVFAEAAGTIDLVYFGARLPDGEDLQSLVASSQFGSHENQPDMSPIGGLLPEAKNGYSGRPALHVRLAGVPIRTDFVVEHVSATARSIVILWTDRATQLAVSATWRLSEDGMLQSHYVMSNKGETDVVLEHLPSLVLPLPPRFESMTSFPGRWAREMQETQHQLGRCAIDMRSTGGKPGFDAGNWMLFHCAENAAVVGCHLAWHGDHASHVAQNQDGRSTLIMEARHHEPPPKVSAGQSLTSPTAFFALASDADSLIQIFHRHLRGEVLPRRQEWGPRKVHLNSWEALGFSLSEPAVMTLADDAAALGVERFVLDDGWFKGRRSDRSGLGDWTPDPQLFPNGLGPLIDQVKGLGMDFGLWIEPEMVSPDSDLYRAHPDWCLHNSATHRPTERHQLVLDLSRRDVMDYLISAIHGLLAQNEIAYLKWDHNRRLFPTGTAQASGYFALLDTVASAFPHVEIENCSSGGGRIDFKSLTRAHRVWPSDNNDPVERLRINQSWTRFLPLEILGNHVGPSPNPITGRRTDMDFRAKVAVFGHMGVEADPSKMDAAERAVLAEHIALYKHWRTVLHTGELWQLSHPDPSIFGQIVVNGDKAIAFAAQTGFAENFNVAPLRLKGLEAEAIYTVTLPKPWPTNASQYLANPKCWNGDLALSGRALMEHGLALPLTHLETAWIITLERKRRA